MKSCRLLRTVKNLRVTALVSGHPDKANKLAQQYGVNPRNIYNYQNYDSIRDDPKVTSFTLFCQTECMPNTQFADFRRANTS